MTNATITLMLTCHLIGTTTAHKRRILLDDLPQAGKVVQVTRLNSIKILASGKGLDVLECNVVTTKQKGVKNDDTTK